MADSLSLVNATARRANPMVGTDGAAAALDALAYLIGHHEPSAAMSSNEIYGLQVLLKSVSAALDFDASNVLEEVGDAE